MGVVVLSGQMLERLEGRRPGVAAALRGASVGERQGAILMSRVVFEWVLRRFPVEGGRPGLGDLVYRVANPIARILDRVLGTRLRGCGGCARRRRALNRWTDKLRGRFSRSAR